MLRAAAQEAFLIPVPWVKFCLVSVSISGIGFGFFSFVFPVHSIRFYQGIMKCFNWRAEPLDPEREVQNTRWLGFVMIALGIATMLLMTRD